MSEPQPTAAPPPTPPANSDTAITARPKRGAWRRRPTIFIGSVSLFGLLYLGLGYLAVNLTHETTDDAFLDADIVSVAPKVAGQVAKVQALNNRRVKAGDVLLEIDPQDLQVALDEKKAALDSARANTELLKSALDLTRAMVVSAQATAKQSAAEAMASQATAERAAADLKRGQGLIADRTISPQEFDAIEAGAKAAEASHDAARAKAASDESKVAETEAAAGTAVKAFERAEAQTRQTEWDLKAAEQNLAYARLTAPIDGVVTKKAVASGDYVQVGQRLLALVPEDFYVTANYKETQIKAIRPGQVVEIAVDSIEHGPFAGHVDSIMAGSGARFSLLPPENAVGNYVKVVQRIPVKILFDHPLKADHALGPGMSVVPSIRVSDHQFSGTVVLATSGALAFLVGALWFAAARKP